MRGGKKNSSATIVGVLRSHCSVSDQRIKIVMTTNMNTTVQRPGEAVGTLQALPTTTLNFFDIEGSAIHRSGVGMLRRSSMQVSASVSGCDGLELGRDRGFPRDGRGGAERNR
jgi:hypothetical protein